YHLVQCISNDGTMTPEFQEQCDWLDLSDELLLIGDCVQHGRVLSVVSRGAGWDRTTYKIARTGIFALRKRVERQDIRKIALRRRTDGLEWHRIRDLLKEAFDDTDVEILVCK